MPVFIGCSRFFRVVARPNKPVRPLAFRSIPSYMGPMARTVGIDPGAKGAIALIEGDSAAGFALTIRDMPAVKVGKKGKLRVDPAALASMLREFNPAHVWVEDVHAMPGNGAVSMFSFGMAFGFAYGVPLALGFPITLIGPAQWKSAMRCGVDNARDRASQLLPKHAGMWPLKGHDGRAEAALIALYGSTRGVAQSFIEW